MGAKLFWIGLCRADITPGNRVGSIPAKRMRSKHKKRKLRRKDRDMRGGKGGGGTRKVARTTTSNKKRKLTKTKRHGKPAANDATRQGRGGKKGEM